MAEGLHLLTDAHIRNARPQEKMYTLKDGGSLFVEVFPNGGKYFRFGFRFPKGDKTKRKLTLGAYPKVSLKTAREMAQAARERLAAGIDPRIERRARRAEESSASLFATVATEWLEANIKSYSPHYRRGLERYLTKHLFPALGAIPVDGITETDLMRTLQPLLDAGHVETANRVLRTADFVFRHAVKTGLTRHNPAQNLKGVLPTAVVKHMPALTDPADIGPLLLRIDRYSGNFVTQCALKLSPLLTLRPGELRRLEWRHVDFERAEIRLPIEHMKRRQTEKDARQGELAHTVPLSRQALDILRALHTQTGASVFVFAGNGKKAGCMSENTVNAALKKLGYQGQMTGHGFRHMASTNLHEMDFPSHYVEKQLAHADRNRIRATYNHAQHLDQRRRMMQAWADWLDERKEEARRKEVEASGGGAGE